MTVELLTDILTGTALAIMIATMVGLLTFRWLYRPFAAWRHGRMGAHLIYMFDVLLVLYAHSLMAFFIPMPPWLYLGISNIVYAAICWVVWQRVDLYRDFSHGDDVE